MANAIGNQKPSIIGLRASAKNRLNANKVPSRNGGDVVTPPGMRLYQ
ncbi:hypothetical protein OH492_05960 [Vibrio chagasii]|nr:hypothetical protein [Vibrio chagasii]